jgi:hypothetical protein
MGLWQKFFGRGAAGVQIDALRTKVAIQNATSAPTLDKQIDDDVVKLLETLRKEPPKPLIVYTAVLVSADLSTRPRVVAAEVDWFGMGRQTVEKMKHHMDKALLPGERIEVQEVQIIDGGKDGAPVTIRPLKNE